MNTVTRSDKKRVEKATQAILTAWLQSGMPGEGRVHGSEPIGGKYPAEGLVVSFSLGLDFPSGISDEVGATVRDAVASYVAEVDQSLMRRLQAEGYGNLDRYWDDDGDGLSLAHHFPPMLGNEGASVMRCFRAVTAKEKRSYEAETGEAFPPFSDEQWVMVRYAGINMFRTIEWRPRRINE